MTRLIHIIIYEEKITSKKHLKQWFRSELILKIVSYVFVCVCVCLLFYMVISVFYKMISACFKDYDFGITEFVLSVYIVASAVVSVYIHKKSTREECSPDNTSFMLD